MKRHLGLPEDYGVAGFIVYGTYQKFPYDVVRQRLEALGHQATFATLPRFLEPVLEITLQHRRYWFAVAVGGALLSEWTHLACLFGSQANVVLGSCGGLFPEAETRDVIVPTFSYGDESTTRSYSAPGHHQHSADTELRGRLASLLKGGGHRVWEGPTVTHQAMMGETWDDVQAWSQAGYYGVEMEASTVFAVSNHFSVPAAAAVMVGDNLIHQETVLDLNYVGERPARRQITHDLVDAAISAVMGSPTDLPSATTSPCDLPRLAP